MKRVVVTGMAGMSPIGLDWAETAASLQQMRSGIRFMHEWDKYVGLNTRLGGPVEGFEKPEHYSRKAVRSMGRVALMSTWVSELALKDAGLFDDPWLKSGDVGVSYGSSTGSPDATRDFANMMNNDDTAGITANTYLKMMSHTAPVNIGVYFGLRGRVYTTSSACTSGSRA